MISGRPSNRLDPKEGAPASQIVSPSVASSLYCGRGVPGGSRPRHSAAAAARPAGDDCATGSKRVFGSGSTSDCSTGSATRPLSTGHERAWTPCASRRKGGRAHGVEAGRPGQTRLQVSPGSGSQRHLVGGPPLGCQGPRRDPTAAAGRRYPAHHRAREESRAGRASAPPSSTPTRRMSARTSVALCAPAASSHSLPGGGSTPLSD
jgi:hypothetical protein